MLSIVLKSLRHRTWTSFFITLSLSLSLTLFLGILRLSKGVDKSFTDQISEIDLIVGAKTGSMQLLLYTVFHLGQAVNNVSYTEFESLKANPMVKEAIPISLGDSYKGHRVVATTPSFFEHYRFAGDKNLQMQNGTFFQGAYQVVIGSAVAKKFSLKIGDPIIIGHGITPGGISHEDSPFRVQGILETTLTSLDQILLISLQSMELLHVGWSSMGYSKDDRNKKLQGVDPESIPIKQITAVFVKTVNPIFTLRLKKMLDDSSHLMAIMPAITLQEIWAIAGQIEQVLAFIAIITMLTTLIGMLVSLSLQYTIRQQELYLWRAIGLTSFKLRLLLLAENFILMMSSIIISIINLGLFSGLSQSHLGTYFGIRLSVFPLVSGTEAGFILIYVTISLLFTFFSTMVNEKFTPQLR